MISLSQIGGASLWAFAVLAQLDFNTNAMTHGPSEKEGAFGLRLVDLGVKSNVKETTGNDQIDGRITSLILDLAKTEAPDLGYSGTTGGRSFLPLRQQDHEGAQIIMAHGLNRSDALTELVKIGPRALPALLQNLDNKTPTMLVIKHHDDDDALISMGGMDFSAEISGNPMNSIERRVLGDAIRSSYRFGSSRGGGSKYTVKVGDLCFVAIGQIVGRSYSAIRYQMTAIIVVSSPVEDTGLANKTKAIWSTKTPRQFLCNSLLVDYATREDKKTGTGTNQHGWNQRSSTGDESTWGWASWFQCESALRLLYYYPEQSVELIAGRLRTIDVSAARVGSVEWAKRDALNEVDTIGFVRAVAWCEDERIRTEIDRITGASSDSGIVQACIEGTENADLILKRCELYFKRLQKFSYDPNAYDGEVLDRLIQIDSEKSAALLRQYASRADADRRISLCVAFRDLESKHREEILAPLLDDTRVVADKLIWIPPHALKSMRVCDVAAAVLNHWDNSVEFSPDASITERDNQIAKFKQRKPSSP